MVRIRVVRRVDVDLDLEETRTRGGVAHVVTDRERALVLLEFVRVLEEERLVGEIAAVFEPHDHAVLSLHLRGDRDLLHFLSRAC